VDEADWKDFGEWVEQLRVRAGLQVGELAERAGVSRIWLQVLRRGGRPVEGKWQTPNPKDESLVRLAHALEVPPEEMLARAGRGAPSASGKQAEPTVSPAERNDSDALRRIRELEARMAQYQQELAELRELVEGQPPRRAKSQ
jgi:transcriptional regulator with XRE-family HTH domain